jgi:hypothetical protein
VIGTKDISTGILQIETLPRFEQAVEVDNGFAITR